MTESLIEKSKSVLMEAAIWDRFAGIYSPADVDVSDWA